MKCKLPECSSQVDPEARKGTMFCGAACRAEYHRRRRLNLLAVSALPPSEDPADMVMPGGMMATAEQTPTFASPTTTALPLRNPRKRRRVKSRLSVPRTIHIDESPAAQPTAPTQPAKQRHTSGPHGCDPAEDLRARWDCNDDAGRRVEALAQLRQPGSEHVVHP